MQFLASGWLRSGATRLAAAMLLVAAAPVAAQAAPAAADSSELTFLGFRAGASLAEVEARLGDLGHDLDCKASRKDPRVQDCRAALTDPDFSAPIELWLSSIDGVIGVMTLSASLNDEELTRWRESLMRRYGEVGARGQGPQWMMQWVRRRRMLRLTWRGEKGRVATSVSLVDGRTLDGWTAPRR